MDKNTQQGPETIGSGAVIVAVAVAGLVVLSLSTGYFLGLTWLLTLLAPLTFPQAAVVAVLVVASGYLNLARLPKFEIGMIFLGAVVFAILALVEVLLARLVVLLTPLTPWEASLLVASTAALLIFIVIQTILDSANYDELDIDIEDDWDASTAAHHLSSDMYVLRPRATETPASKPPRAARRRRSRKKTNDTDSD